MLDLSDLRPLVASGAARDRAFVDALLRMRWSSARDSAEKAGLVDLLHDLRDAAAASHCALRARIADGSLRGAPLRARFEEVPLLERDHFVEEVLGVAYPPLDEPSLERELVAYQPSGYDEIVHAFDTTGLAPGERFLDLGSGTGKAVLLATLLCGASSTGIELDGAVHAIAISSARSWALDVDLRHEDARSSLLPRADVAFLYIPFTGSTLVDVLARLETRFVCTSVLDLAHHPHLTPVGAARSWLQVYASG